MDEEKKELRRIRQKYLRSQDTGERRAMINWNNSDKGKLAIKKYRESERYKQSRLKGTVEYKKKQIMLKGIAVKAYKNRQEWTIDSIKKLEEMFALGLTQKEIAIKLGRTLRAIEHKINRLGLKNG